MEEPEATKVNRREKVWLCGYLDEINVRRRVQVQSAPTLQERCILDEH